MNLSVLVMILSLVMSLFIAPTATVSAPVPTVSAQAPERTLVSCPEQGFTTMADPSHFWAYEEGNGVTIYTEYEGYVPYVMVFRRTQKLNNPVNYLNNVYREYMEGRYGDVGTTPCREVKIGGKTLYRADYHYSVNGNALCLARLVEVRADGDVEYSAKYIEGEEDTVMDALDTAVRYYQATDSAEPVSGPQPAVVQPETQAPPAQTAAVQTELFTCDDFSITIPKGWKVESGGGRSVVHSIRVYDPSEPLNQMFITMKAQVLLHSQEGKELWQFTVPYNADPGIRMFAEAPVLTNPSTEGFYRIFSAYAAHVENTGGNVFGDYAGYTFPRFDDFTVIERFPSYDPMASVALGPELLYASFTANGRAGEGMFSASVVDAGRMDMMKLDFSGMVDAGNYMAYNIMAITTARGSFDALGDTLLQCMATLRYTDDFIDAVNRAGDEQLATSTQIYEESNRILDGIMDAWDSMNSGN